MAETENVVVVVRFTDPSKAYQAMSMLKECAAEGRIGLESAAIVERTETGELHIPEGTDNVELLGTASGSLLGMLIGVLGGPVGVLVGWGSGAPKSLDTGNETRDRHLRSEARRNLERRTNLVERKVRPGAVGRASNTKSSLSPLSRRT